MTKIKSRLFIVHFVLAHNDSIVGFIIQMYHYNVLIIYYTCVSTIEYWNMGLFNDNDDNDKCND